MGKGGDLNNKKSWHPLKATNIHATQKAEAEAIAERKKLQARLDEIKEDRRNEELQKALEAAGGKAKPYDPKLAWMYAGPTDGQGTEDEAYLLGKRRIDKLLEDNEKQRLQKQASRENFTAGPTTTIARDTAAKIREDPLLAMMRVQQETYEALQNDPIRRRQILASAGIADTNSKSKGEERRHKHRHHHRHSRHHRSKEDEEDYEDDRHSRKQRSTGIRERSRSPRRLEDSGDEKYSRRRRRSYSRDQSPSQRRRRGSDEERESRNWRSRDSRNKSRSRSRGVQDRLNEDGPRSLRGYDSKDRGLDDRKPNSCRYGNDAGDRRPRDRSPSTGRYESGNRGARRNDWARGRNGNFRSDGRDDAEERARKLQAMQADASALDDDRERRIAAIEEADNAAQEADERARQRDKYRSDRHFTASIHRQVADRVG